MYEAGKGEDVGVQSGHSYPTYEVASPAVLTRYNCGSGYVTMTVIVAGADT